MLVTHGFGEHSGRYAEVVAALTERGLLVATYDLRGHGRSGGERGHVLAFEDYVRDATALLDELRADAQFGRIERPALFGHSLGGLISTHLALSAQERFSGLALTSPFFGLALEVPAVKLALGRGMSRWFPRFSQPTGLSGAHVTHDAEIARAYDTDPLGVKRCSARWFTETTRAQEEALARASELRLPVFVMAAGDDRVAALAATRRVFERVASPNKELRVLDGLYHEVLNEVDRAPLIAALATRIRGWFP